LYVFAIHQVKQIKDFQTKAWYQFNLDMKKTIFLWNQITKNVIAIGNQI
jgi:hypothetical protein